MQKTLEEIIAVHVNPNPNIMNLNHGNATSISYHLFQYSIHCVKEILHFIDFRRRSTASKLNIYVQKNIKGLFWKHIGSPSDQRQVFGRGCVSTEIIGESISSNNYWVSDANTKYSVAHRGGVSIYFAESRFDSMFIHI